MASSSSSQVLPDSPDDLWLMHSNFIGVALSNVTYGITLTVFWITVHGLLTSRSKSKMNKLLLAFTIIVFVLATVAVGTNIQFATLNFIDFRNFDEGGIIGYNETQFNSPVVMLSMASYMAIGWVADALMLFRTLLIWGYNYYVIIIPTIMFLGSLASSIAMLITFINTRSGDYVWGALAIKFGTAFWSLSLTFNVLVTCLIAGRIIANSRRLRGILGPRHAAIYSSVATLVIESGLLYAAAGLAYFITFVLNSYVQNILIGPFGQIQAISPMLIILRVAQGRSWDEETTNTSTWKASTATNVSTTQDVDAVPIPLGHIVKGDPLKHFRESGSTTEIGSLRNEYGYAKEVEHSYA